jgi:hypothetical protein
MIPRLHARVAVPRRRLSCLAVFAALILLPETVAAQATAPSGSAGISDLATRVQERFDVLPLRGGLALRPKERIGDVRSIEIAGGTIAIDGIPVTGAELRNKVGELAADVILRLSYLDPAEQRTFVETAAEPTGGATGSTQQAAPERRARRSTGDRVRIGGSVAVEAGELITGDAVAIGGSVDVEGEVRGDVVAIGGSVSLGPRASVRGDVVVIGGSLNRDPGASVGGHVKEFGWGMIATDRYVPPAWFGRWWQRGLGSSFALASTLTRLAVLCLFAMLVVLLGNGYLERVAARARADALKAGVIGFLSQLLFIPLLAITIVFLVVTIVGIPLLVFIPFLVIGFGLVALIGFAAVAQDVGRWIVRRFGWPEIGPFGGTLLGIVTILSPLLAARLIGLIGISFPITTSLVLLGGCVEYLAWTVGFGAVALVKFQKASGAGQ